MKAHGNLVHGECFNSLLLSIGQLIVTCGSLEFETHVWIWGFSSDEADKEKWRQKWFKDRKRHVVEVVKALPVDPLIISAAETIWDEAERAMDVRNTIAHSPVIFMDRGADVPHLMKVADLRTAGGGNMQEYSQKEIDEATNTVNDINHRLQNIRPVIEQAVGKKINLNYQE
jgi:hypothetical protein